MFAAPEIFNGCQGAVGVDMACAGAIPQLRNVVAHIRVFMLLVGICLVITCMTAGTSRLVGGKTPVYGLCIIGMAISTG